MAEPVSDNPNLLWYNTPADRWVQALPIGNGRLGAMIFGQPKSERLQLNDVTVWSGGPQPDADRKDACKGLPELRQLIRDGKYAEAENFANAHFNGPARYDASCQTLGDLKFEFLLPDGTGWSMAWKENLWARLRDGDHAQRLLSDQLRFTDETRVVMADVGGTYPNLFDAHPLFQIDGNFGAVAGITEMLLQSHERCTDPKVQGVECYVIDVLPALPKAWPTGSVKGIRARGGFEVDIKWREGKLVQATIRSLTGGSAQLRFGSVTHDIKLAKDGTFNWNGQ